MSPDSSRSGHGVAFITPLRLESFGVRRGAPGSLVERIGMGPVRATAARARLGRTLAAGRPVALVGFAGALGFDLRPGDLVVASELGSIDSDETFALVGPREVADLVSDELRSSGRTNGVRVGPVVSSPSLVKGDATRTKAAARGAIAVDMESIWCAPLARHHPFAVVRVIVDVPGHDVRSSATPRAALAAYRSVVVAARALQRWEPGSPQSEPPLEVGEP